ncbi:MAG: energy-converting hydrogenase subunit [Thermotogaceae bacterium]|nr:energy-converting hydrogenase subunit [Thermotogaceae bacterium]
MIEIIGVITGALIIVFGILAVESKKLINSVVYLSLLSLLSVLSFIIMKAPDVAITEAVIGSGLVTFLFIITLMQDKKAGDKK